MSEKKAPKRTKETEPDVKAEVYASDAAEMYIVGIGASAGGLEALQSLLSALPSNLGFPYVIVQHLSPDYKSLLSEILGKNSDMPIVQAENGMHAEPNCIYIIPPAKNIFYKNGKLLLEDQEPGNLHLPIDTFFESIAVEAGRRAISIVLSGTGSDGTNGIKMIKENEGVVLVQKPGSCKFDGMPKSAIRTGLVDIQGTPEDIAAELEHIAAVAKRQSYAECSDKEIDDALMNRIYYILRKASGINFSHYKKATLLRRVERRMVLAHKDSLAEYVDYLYAVADEAKILSKEVLIGVTNFFREPEYFEILREKAIIPLLTNSTAEDTIRVWVAGCSTGEEAYSIAILFCEAMEQMKIKRDVKIFATDLDSEAIAIAGKGVFGNNIAACVSASRLSKFFSRKENNYVINRDIRRMLVFAPHNVVQDPPFGKLDLISCRNLLIYFQPVLQKDLFSIFHVALKDGGFLFLGKSEAVGSYTEVFPVVDALAKLFTHRSDIKIKGAKPIPHLQVMLEESDSFDSFVEENSKQSDIASSDEQNEKLRMNTLLLEQFMPACLVVDNKNELAYVYGDCRDYVSVPTGRVTNAIFDLLTESLRIPVSTALTESREKGKKVQYTGISFSGISGTKTISLTATPVGKNEKGADYLYALVFSEISSVEESPDAVKYDLDHMAAQRITDLEQELSRITAELSQSTSEQETVNEELQASNEELLTANEELQSSNEELQSVNEELYTVNSEYQLKLSELAELNDDITNFLATTLIGVIFVDDSLRIRRYTNYVTAEFNLVEQDIGRSIDFLSYQFKNINLASECKRVMDSLAPDEQEVVTSRGKTFFMRVAPFRTTENKILGCVITIVDVTTQRQEQEKLRETEDQLTIAKRASEAKSDFLSRMSHEIRTPMNAVVGLTEMMENQFDNKEAMHLTAQNLRETVRYMTSIVTDILEMTKIEHAQIELDTKPFVMSELLRRVISMTELRMAECGLTFKTVVSDSFEPYYVGDATRIQQVLMNLLGNASKYTPAGGSVTFKACEIANEKSTSTIQFIISDTGVGMSKEFIAEAFKPFARESQKLSSSSMGLGLPIADSLVKLMNGSIEVESELNKGSVFTVTIKLLSIGSGIDDDAGIRKATVENADKDYTGMKVLIAEDNDMNLLILESLLGKSGIEFVSARDGEQAVSMYLDAPEYAFDCILLDMRMPKLDGTQAAEQIRSSGKADAESVPIVAISANAFTEDLDSAREAGINEYITKPVDTKRLFKLLKKFWSKSKNNPGESVNTK